MPVGPYFADLLCRSRKLVVELDGFSHDLDPARDVRRDAHLRSLGFRVLHFSNDDVMANAEGVVQAIRAALAHP
jgi:very-short-patch-repair endonuclease